ncbi:unnamed protein product (macronuclear) [Paramecium tetraurelia]|uniref:Transmembrane protein n=1 Tax=Paramecium tetraurelia TaxID=5888 RepID=A0D1B9_PARTE|nr:uncharacterized protein GSPATT00012360001 [Paramecium tetraurelia]CAK76836.1 unnamed protein product [Paramecium tetraurelia]|eukprot:XP_001444233.1 hypothetical protein (macronuclear) [Paramecium tetraurelia strain d4-2]
MTKKIKKQYLSLQILVQANFSKGENDSQKLSCKYYRSFERDIIIYWNNLLQEHQYISKIFNKQTVKLEFLGYTFKEFYDKFNIDNGISQSLNILDILCSFIYVTMYNIYQLIQIHYLLIQQISNSGLKKVQFIQFNNSHKFFVEIKFFIFLSSIS